VLEPVLTNPWVRALGIILALVLLSILIYLLSPVLVPLFFAFLVAYTLDPVVDFFERRKISRSVSIGLLATTAIVLAVAIPVYVVPSVITQADALIDSTRKGDDDSEVSAWLVQQVNRLPLEALVESLDWVPTEDADGVAVEDYDALQVITEKVATRVKESASSFLRAHTGQIASVGASTGSGLIGILGSIGSRLLAVLLFLGNLALFAFVAVYLLKDYDSIIGAAKELVPLRWRSTTFRIMGEIDGQVRGFLRGQMLVCICLGVMYAVGLMVAGVPFALLIAAFGAVASFVPYLGLALTIGPALVLCFMQYGLEWQLGVVVGTFVVAQLLEGTVLTPKIVGEQVGLGPVWVILAVLVFGNFMGFLGLLLAVPIAASLKVLVVESHKYYKTSPLYQGPASGG